MEYRSAVINGQRHTVAAERGRAVMTSCGRESVGHTLINVESRSITCHECHGYAVVSDALVASLSR